MSSKRIEDCSDPLRAAWPALKQAFQAAWPGWTMLLSTTYVPPEEQKEKFKVGRFWNVGVRRWEIDATSMTRVVTDHDGVKLKSKHNDLPARAFDVEIYSPEGVAQPYPAGRQQWDWLAANCAASGLVTSEHPGHFSER